MQSLQVSFVQPDEIKKSLKVDYKKSDHSIHELYAHLITGQHQQVLSVPIVTMACIGIAS